MAAESLVTLGALLGAVLLLIVATLVWQEARKRGGSEPVAYVVDDAVDFIVARAGSRMSRADVRRIIEYEVFYLQGLAQRRRSNPVDVVAGGSDGSVRYIAAQIAENHDVAYAPEEIEAVLSLEAEYLVSIGAVGDPVDDAEPDVGGDTR